MHSGKRGLTVAAAVAMAASFAISSLQARPATTQEKEAVRTVVQEFVGAVRTKDATRTMDLLPPRVWSKLESRYKTTSSELRTRWLANENPAHAPISIEADTRLAVEQTLSDGTPYFLVPMVVVRLQGGQKIRTRSLAVALLDNGTWYLMNVATQSHLDDLNCAYPALRIFSMPLAHSEPLKD